MRTHDAGTLRASDAGTTVTLAGWIARRRDHGGVVFLDVRDGSGYAQVVVREEEAHALRNEFCVLVTGEVQRRPEGNENPELPSGEIEVVASTLQVLSASAPLPFPIETAQAAGDDVRYAHRYLDLRRQGPAKVMKLRSEVNRVARGVMADLGFTEVETPSLTRSTPEGARDFVVPVRLQPGSWYALPQSPQLFKQLLMIGGLERYYQIARCFRDEDFRADRQPEFTQLDFEMSFVDRDDVLDVASAVVTALWRELADHEVGEIPRMTYREAMDRFGSDKPDTRFGVELVELTEYFADTPFRVFQSPYVGAVVMPGGGSQPRRTFDAWQDWARSRGAKGLAYVTVAEDGTLGGPVTKNISDAEREGLVAAVGAQPGDCIFFAAGPRRSAQELLGAARNEIAKRLELVPEGSWAFLFVVDFPMFEETEDGGWTFMHHPFTSPTPEWRERFAEDKGAALSDAYDLVINGNECMSGSVRIHDAGLQERVFETLGMSTEEARDRFGFFLEAFAYGPPPHAGAALGWDRLVALLAGVDSIREVIAFPKTGAGYDPLTGAPTPISAAQRKEAGIDAEPVQPEA
ncbi:aspartate--tRNA ligase [Klenkia taihuensis]|uniref:aspartate--tRNA ligase n=1 Tax=Klenkia taihuensis TaxID=1225127 RepID=UPI0019ACE124|nr:aspartate--tRNA ligase [Klenkia taihuensis]GHE12915.1 aspartate--tRNA ligase [Klenkia taihuensis]